MWTTLYLRIDRKRKNELKKFAGGGLNIECERYWSVGLGAELGDWQKIKNKTIFVVSEIFQAKVDSLILLGFECTLNPQNSIKIVGAIFEKIKILIFYVNHP